jgi:hypothetical protein
VTLTAAVSGPTDEAAPTGSVTFSVVGSNGSAANCTGSNVVTLSGTTAKCVLAAGQLRAAGVGYAVTATYNGAAGYLGSSATLKQSVTGIQTTSTAVSLTLLPSASRPIIVLAGVLPSKLALPLLSGSATLTVTNAAGAVVYSTSSTLLPILPLTDFAVPAGKLVAGSYTLTVSYPGDEYYAPSSTHLSVKVGK